jgi:hypothetical protein
VFGHVDDLAVALRIEREFVVASVHVVLRGG